MRSVKSSIISRLHSKGAGYVFTPGDLLDCGSRQAVDTTLCRLVSDGKIRRLAQGVYDYPKKHPVLGDLYPKFDDIAKAIARGHGAIFQLSGAKAVHLLGLSMQVPAQTVYLTNGPTRQVKVGMVTFKMQHAGAKIMSGAGKKAGVVLQAIRHIGKNHLNTKVAEKISSQLDSGDIKDLKKLIRYAPQWSKEFIELLVAA